MSHFRPSLASFQMRGNYSTEQVRVMLAMAPNRTVTYPHE